MRYTDAAILLRKNGLLKKLPNKEWEVAEEFIWYIDFDDKSYFVVVPKGFITDFGSIPKVLQNIFSPTDYLAYVLHDYLYSPKGYISEMIGDIEMKQHLYSRKLTDKIMKDAIQVEGGLLLERNLIYLGVRIGGGWNFKV